MTPTPDLRTLTVRELKAQLDRYPDDLPVCLAAFARDHWGTPLAQPVQEARMRDVAYSEYHQGFAVLREAEDSDGPSRQVLLIGER